MQEREARLLKESGDLDKVVISPSADNKGWSMKLVAKNGDGQMLNSKRSKDPRVFKTSDAALRCCLRIGVNTAVVDL
jgi:hypothetical protein